MVFHTIGDSHSLFGWKEIPEISIHHLGARLCFSVGRDGLESLTNFDVNEGDTVIFSFGEIDCRCHVHKHINEDTDYKNIIDSLVNNYFVKIKAAIDSFTNLRIAVYNVVPAVEKSDVLENPYYPYLGTDEERKEYVLYFNKVLKERSLEYDYVFFDVYDKYIDERGYLNKSLSDGNVHITDERYIREYLETNLGFCQRQ